MTGGVGVSSKEGLHADTRTRTFTTHSYTCELRGPDRRRLRLDLSGDSGSVLGEGDSIVYSISPLVEKMTWEHPQLRGFLIDSGEGKGLAFVQTSFDGVVVFSANLAGEQRDTLAVVCVAVLLRGKD
jgi:hypothetical protein